MSILLRPNIRAWFLHKPLDVPELSSPKTERVWLTPLRAFSIVAAALIAFLWLVNQFVRVARAGDERSMGIIEYHLFR
jgi:hypothetical protein